MGFSIPYFCKNFNPCPLPRLYCKLQIAAAKSTSTLSTAKSPRSTYPEKLSPLNIKLGKQASPCTKTLLESTIPKGKFSILVEWNQSNISTSLFITFSAGHSLQSTARFFPARAKRSMTPVPAFSVKPTTAGTGSLP